jgi:hypothetical protein
MHVEVDNFHEIRSKRKVARSAFTRNLNRVGEIRNKKESVSKVIEETRKKARTLINELEKS